MLLVWQRSIFSSVLKLSASSEGSTSPATALGLTLTATLPFGVAVADCCLGQLLTLDASRRLWRCAPGSSLTADEGAAGSSAGTTYVMSTSVATLGTYAVIFSASTATAHPNLADVWSPPPPPPGTGGAASLAAADNATDGGSGTNSTGSGAGGSALSPYVAAFAMALLFLAALISCVGLCVKGSPMEFEREEDEDAPEGRKVYPLFPGMPGYSGE